MSAYSDDGWGNSPVQQPKVVEQQPQAVFEQPRVMEQQRQPVFEQRRIVEQQPRVVEQPRAEEQQSTTIYQQTPMRFGQQQQFGDNRSQQSHTPSDRFSQHSQERSRHNSGSVSRFSTSQGGNRFENFAQPVQAVQPQPVRFTQPTVQPPTAMIPPQQTQQPPRETFKVPGSAPANLEAIVSGVLASTSRLSVKNVDDANYPPCNNTSRSDEATLFMNSRLLSAYAAFGQELITLNNDYQKRFGGPAK